GFSTFGRTVAPLFALAVNTIKNLVVPVVHVRGRVVDPSGTPVANVTYSGWVGAHNSCCGGIDSFSTTSAADGSFAVTVLQGSYSGLTLTPPPSSPYAITTLPDVNWPSDVTQDVTIQRIQTLSGTVRLGDGSVLTSGTIAAMTPAQAAASSPVPAEEQVTSAIDAQGHYSLALAPNTYYLDVIFKTPGFSTYGRRVATVQFTQTANLDLSV